MNRKVKKNQIFHKLLASYFIFAILALILVLIGTRVIFQLMTNGQVFSLLPQRVISKEGELQNTRLLNSVGGWIEELNDDYRVIRVIGQKRTARQHYRENELLMMVGSADADKDYSMFYENTGEHRYLIYVPKNMNIVSTDKGQLIMPRTRLFVIVGLLTFFMIVEAIVLSLYLYRKIQYPLAELTDATQRVREGERDVQLDFDAEGEFIILRDAANDMIRTFAEQEAENQELIDSQRRLMLEISHDFQTPVASIMASTKALEDGVVAEKDIRRYYQIIQEKSKRLSDLTGDMLALLKLRDKDYKPHLEPLDICESMRRITSEYYSDIQLSNLTLGVNIPDEPITVMADEDLLRRAVFNLLSNAIKYNRTGSQIGVAVLTLDPDIVSIQVSDDGEEIPAEVSEIMFDAFARDDKARKTTGGTGLGLTIVREISEHHHGKVFYYYRNGWNVMDIRIPQA